MKLNPDCIRDILLVIENTTTYEQDWDWDFNTLNEPLLSSYSHDEILYHISQCNKAGLIDGCEFYFGATAGTVRDLSPYGHQFLADTRSDTVWNNVKTISQTIGANSIQTLTQIASGVISEIIKQTIFPLT